MAGIVCPHCLQPLELPLREACPHCGRSLRNANPEGALPLGTLLGGRYTIGEYQDNDGDGLCYCGVDNEQRTFVRIKEFFPVTLCNGRGRDGALLPIPGREVLFKTSLMDFRDLYIDLKNLSPARGLSQILDVLDENNTVYAVEESCKGMTLTHYLSLKARPVSPAEACEMLQPVMEGVAAMHKAGLIHRGICPDNILLPLDGEARLTGYGTLALRTRGSELKSQLYAGYAAPEQYSAAEFAGRYTDVYALAAVIYRMVTRQKPPSAPQRRGRDTMEAAHSLEPSVPNYFSRVLACALRLDPAKRMQTVAELEHALGDPGVASAMLDKGESQVSTRKVLGVTLIVTFVLAALLLWGLMGTADGGPPASPAGSMPAASAGGSQQTLVPDLAGHNYQQEIVGSGLYAGYRIAVQEEYSSEVGAGCVIRQDPAAYTVWQPESTLTLWVSLGPRMVTMPGIIGFPQADAVRALDEAGIRYELQVVENDGQQAAGQVVACSIAEGAEFDADKETAFVSVAGTRPTPPPG